MKKILPQEKLTLLEIEVSEKIDNKNLKNFIYTNFKLKNITTNKNDKTFLIYIKELKKYQIFILNEKYDFFEFQVFEQFYENKEEFGKVDLYLNEDFLCLYKNSKIYYYQKLNQIIQKDELIEFLNKKLQINIDNFKQIDKNEIEKLKNSYLEKNIKQNLSFLNLNQDYGFIFFVLYLIVILIFSFFIFSNEEKIEQIENKEEITIDILKHKYEFQSFQEKLDLIIQDINTNSLDLQSLEFKQNRLKLILTSSKKEDLYQFLEKNNKNITFSSINLLENSNLYEAVIDAKIFE
ncbi:hypothetical protein [Aliarcobacter butzleri]|uniref:hypothetical protein n=1 Tax=Aliarcobacter butzleri TaxID=28197 RepID=UPI0021B1DC89|nr:hypothetical protein [Aliarcobacter butzleri]MCT7560972.1 hypothetical protein [Aliarcobacter butzleri]MCT7628155.1 hypothetical protein [Aliarcobacter butzleri]UWY59662.1 hypothetical protein N3115_07810 [Aliarcobacter butzleri]